MPASGTRRQRLDALATYLGYRLIGCDQTAARDKTLREVRGDAGELRLCARFAASPVMPPPSDTFAFRRDLDAALGDDPKRPAEPTHVDPEGEAVWVHEFIRQRRAGQSEREASDAAIAAVRAAAAGQAARLRIVK
jgi:hypothetical protein